MVEKAEGWGSSISTSRCHLQARGVVKKKIKKNVLVGEVLDDEGEVLDDEGEVLDHEGEVLDDEGEVLDDEGEVLDNE